MAMKMEKYLVESGRTAAGELHTNKVNVGYAYRAMLEFAAAAWKLDQVKKALFYGKDGLDWTITQPTLTRPTRDLTGIDINILHSILGIATEAGELVEELTKLLNDYEMEDVHKKLVFETGDVLWYQAMLLRALGTTFEETADLNIQKLMARFPEKFDKKKAIEKDESLEIETVLEDK